MDLEIGIYLSFLGNCREAFECYRDIFGGEIVAMVKYGDSSMVEGISEERKREVMHARLKVGDRVLMASDMSDEMYSRPSGIRVHLGFDDVAEAERIFDALAEGGDVEEAFGPTFWAAGFGMVCDRFGTPWLINCDKDPG